MKIPPFHISIAIIPHFSKKKQLYLQCMEVIRHTLVINPMRLPMMHITLTTSINQENSEELGALLKSLEEDIRTLTPQSAPFFQLQRNSPYDIVVVVCGAIVTLLPVVQFLYYMTGSIKSGQDILGKSGFSNGRDKKRMGDMDKKDTPYYVQEITKKQKTMTFGSRSISITTEHQKSYRYINVVEHVISGEFDEAGDTTKILCGSNRANEPKKE